MIFFFSISGIDLNKALGGVYLACSGECLSPFWFGFRKSSPFSSHTWPGVSQEVGLCVPLCSTHPTTGPQLPQPMQGCPHVSRSISQVTLPFFSFFQMFGIHFVLQSFCTQAKPISLLALGHHL